MQTRIKLLEADVGRVQTEGMAPAELKTFATARNLEGGACTSGAGAYTSSSRADQAGTAAFMEPEMMPIL